jgi:hypothetical protein
MRFREISETVQAYDLETKYNTFNRAYFGGELPTIPLGFADLKRASGVVNYRTTRDHKLIDGSMRLNLSSRFKWNEEQLDSTLIHEMIHVYFLNRGFTREGHGIRFKAMMNKLRRETGRNITLTDTVDGIELANPTAVKAVGVILLTKVGGGHSFSLISAKTAHADHEKILALWQRRTGFQAVAVYTVATPAWTEVAAKFPISRKPDPGLYIMKDPSLVLNLDEHGHKLGEIKKTG